MSGVIQTATEKLVTLTRRTATELAVASRDPTLVRHIYDPHMMRGHVDPALVATSRATSRRLTPGNSATSIGPARGGHRRRDTQGARCMRTDPLHRERYASFMADMVHGERPEFDEAIGTVAAAAQE